MAICQSSPDGIINGDTVLEIKCPDVTDLDTLIAGKKYDVKKCDDGTVFLDPKGPRGYYMQIQLTMLCCGMDKAVLFLWRSEEDFQLVDISKDESYLSSIVSRLSTFYFTNVLPRIVDDFHGKRLIFSPGYAALCRAS